MQISTASLTLFALLAVSSFGQSIPPEKIAVTQACQSIFDQVIFYQVAMDPDDDFSLMMRLRTQENCKLCLLASNVTMGSMDVCMPCLNQMSPWLIQDKIVGCTECMNIKGAGNKDSCFECMVNVVTLDKQQHCQVKTRVKRQLNILRHYIIQTLEQ